MRRYFRYYYQVNISVFNIIYLLACIDSIIKYVYLVAGRYLEPGNVRLRNKHERVIFEKKFLDFYFIFDFIIFVFILS